MGLWSNFTVEDTSWSNAWWDAFLGIPLQGLGRELYRFIKN
jgi:hypothetical protein